MAYVLPGAMTDVTEFICKELQAELIKDLGHALIVMLPEDHSLTKVQQLVNKQLQAAGYDVRVSGIGYWSKHSSHTSPRQLVLYLHGDEPCKSGFSADELQERMELRADGKAIARGKLLSLALNALIERTEACPRGLLTMANELELTPHHLAVTLPQGESVPDLELPVPVRVSGIASDQPHCTLYVLTQSPAQRILPLAGCSLAGPGQLLADHRNLTDVVLESCNGWLPARFSFAQLAVLPIADQQMVWIDDLLASDLDPGTSMLGPWVQVLPADQRLGARIRHCITRRIRFAAIIGPEEEQAKMIRLRDCRTGDQKTLSPAQVAKMAMDPALFDQI